MALKWKVDWTNNEYQNDVQTSTFDSQYDANNWIKCQIIDNNVEPENFEVISGPYKYIEPEVKKLWCDAYRPAPKGFIPIKSVAYFADYFVPGVRREFDDIHLISLDTQPDKDGNYFSDLLIYFDNIGFNKFKVHIHGTNKTIKQKFESLAKSNNQTLTDTLNETVLNVNNTMDKKLWIDDIRPAPNGYIWIKSVNDFIDYLVENGINDIIVFDFDHDAGDYQKDGGDYIKCLDYLEFIGADNINVRIHSANPVGRSNMQRIIKKNEWNEVFDIIDEYDESIDEAEDTKNKNDIVGTLKNMSKEFQKNASNNDPEQFAKIVVAFDDLIGGVGKYDFKKKKVLKETDDDINSIEQSIGKICQNIIDAGAPCYSIKLVKSQSGFPVFDITGRFDDYISLDSLHVYWCSGNEYAEPGWYEGTRCKNKWRKIVCDIITNEFPNGLVEGI